MIRLDLTPAQHKQADWGYIDLTEQQARYVRAKLTSAAGAGRKPVLRPCPHCGAVMGATELRQHAPRCPQKLSSPAAAR